MEPTIVGQGSYGCVVKPSLKCENAYNPFATKPNYDNKVSKIMSDRHAIEEQQEMKIFKSIKGIEKYTVAYPKLCKPKKNEQFKKLVEKCNSSPVRKKQAEQNLEGLSLLLLEDGGVDLHQFVRRVFPALSISDKEAFLVSIVDLIEGIEFFVKHNILHHDIKLANIVYNIQTGKAKYIDFGLMEKIDSFIKEAKNSENDMAVSWGYFPSELSCANREEYDTKTKCKKYKKIPYNKFIEKVATSFDGYSLSLALMELFLHIFKVSDYDQLFVIDAMSLIQPYVKKDLATRNTDFAELRKEYKKLLELHKIVSREPSPTKESIELAERLSVASLNHNRQHCPPGKPDYNPTIKKCVVACKDGKERNNKFRCVKTKKTKESIELDKTLSVASLNHSRQHCPPGKPDYNPETKKCAVACKDGKERNNKFRCIKTKKHTSPNRKTKKKTPSDCKKIGKELKPTTGRCVNPCKPGQKRSSEFHCISDKNKN